MTLLVMATASSYASFLPQTQPLNHLPGGPCPGLSREAYVEPVAPQYPPRREAQWVLDREGAGNEGSGQRAGATPASGMKRGHRD